MSPPRTAYSLLVHNHFTSGAHGLILRGISHIVVFMPPLEYLVAGLAILYCFMILVSVSEDNVALGEPNLKSTEFQLVMIVDGLSRPTGLTFLGPDDILVIEEDTGGQEGY
jgi:hypothetical protein